MVSKGTGEAVPVSLGVFVRALDDASQNISFATARALVGGPGSRRGSRTRVVPPLEEGPDTSNVYRTEDSRVDELMDDDPPTVDELFDLFYRLRDDQCFDDWLQLGIPTTVDEDDDGNVDLVDDDLRDLREEQEASKDVVPEPCDDDDDPSNLHQTRSLMVLDEDGNPVRIIGEGNAKRRRMPPSARGFFGHFKSPNELLRVTDPPEETTAEENLKERVKLRMQRIVDRRTSMTTGFSWEEVMRTSLEKELPTHGFRLRRPPVEKDFPFLQFCYAIDARVDALVNKLDKICYPMSFEEYVEECREKRNVLTEGHASEEDVLRSQDLVNTAQELSASAFAADLLLQYVASYIAAQYAETIEQHKMRDKILARGVVLQDDLAGFVTSTLALTQRIEDTQSFSIIQRELEDSVRSAVDSLLQEISDLYDATPFPLQKIGLRDNAKKFQDMLQSSLNAIERLERCPEFRIETHKHWKIDLIEYGYRQLLKVAHLWDSLSLGHVDPDVRHTEATVYDETDIIPKAIRMPMYVRVREMRVDEQQSFIEIAKYVKNRHSQIVGLQLCLSARWILEETGDEHDGFWGFSMWRADGNMSLGNGDSAGAGLPPSS